jgi:hypothetical protein
MINIINCGHSYYNSDQGDELASSCHAAIANLYDQGYVSVLNNVSIPIALILDRWIFGKQLLTLSVFE